MNKFAAVSQPILSKLSADTIRISFACFIAQMAIWFKITRSYLVKYYKLLILLIIFMCLPAILQKSIVALKSGRPLKTQREPELIAKTQTELERESLVLERKLNAKTPRFFYLVINSASNEFSLYKGKELIKKDKCSTGSYILLKKGEEQQWMFKTPKGEFRIQGKKTAPVWKKPDWAFVEEGLSAPSPNHYSRFEYGVLGDYALSLGQGYLIHGTLYQRFLGLPVTHGCIRLNDENLELIYRSLPLGSKVYIY